MSTAKKLIGEDQGDESLADTLARMIYDSCEFDGRENPKLLNKLVEVVQFELDSVGATILGGGIHVSGFKFSFELTKDAGETSCGELHFSVAEKDGGDFWVDGEFTPLPLNKVGRPHYKT